MRIILIFYRTYVRIATAKQYLEQMVRVVNDWPPQSPDLNVIENLWTILKRRIDGKAPKTADELWNCAKTEWNLIPNESFEKLYDSLPRRVESVLATKGGNTKY